MAFTNLKTVTGEVAQPYTFCSIHPTFTVVDWEKAKPVMAEFVRRLARSLCACIMAGPLLGTNCREGYVDGNAVNAHLANVGDCITALLADGVATLDTIEIHGPIDQLEIWLDGLMIRIRVHVRVFGGHVDIHVKILIMRKS